MEHFVSEKRIGTMDFRAARIAEVDLRELIESNVKHEILQQLIDTMEYGKTYLVSIEKTTKNDGFSEKVSFDLKLEKLEK